MLVVEPVHPLHDGGVKALVSARQVVCQHGDQVVEVGGYALLLMRSPVGEHPTRRRVRGGCDKPRGVNDPLSYRRPSHATPSLSPSRPARYPGDPAYRGAAPAARAASQFRKYTLLPSPPPP